MKEGIEVSENDSLESDSFGLGRVVFEMLTGVACRDYDAFEVPLASHRLNVDNVLCLSMEVIESHAEMSFSNDITLTLYCRPLTL